MLWLKQEKAQILPPPAQTENEKVSPGHGNVHGEFISPLFQFAFGLKFSFVSFGTYLPKYRKKRRVSPYFGDSRYLGGIQATIPALQSLRSDLWHFKVFFRHFLQPHKNPAEIHGSFKCSLDLPCQHIVFLNSAISISRKKTKLKMKINKLSHFPFSPLLGKECELF